MGLPGSQVLTPVWNGYPLLLASWNMHCECFTSLLFSIFISSLMIITSIFISSLMINSSLLMDTQSFSWCVHIFSQVICTVCWLEASFRWSILTVSIVNNYSKWVDIYFSYKPGTIQNIYFFNLIFTTTIELGTF